MLPFERNNRSLAKRELAFFVGSNSTDSILHPETTLSEEVTGIVQPHGRVNKYKFKHPRNRAHTPESPPRGAGSYIVVPKTSLVEAQPAPAKRGEVLKIQQKPLGTNGFETPPDPFYNNHTGGLIPLSELTASIISRLVSLVPVEPDSSIVVFDNKLEQRKASEQKVHRPLREYRERSAQLIYSGKKQGPVEG